MNTAGISHTHSSLFTPSSTVLVFIEYYKNPKYPTHILYLCYIFSPTGFFTLAVYVSSM